MNSVNKAALTALQVRKPLRRLLEEKYLYSPDRLRGYIRSIERLPGELSVREAFTINTKGGRPFLFAIASDDVSLARSAASEYALQSETIGLLVISDADTSSIEFLRRRFDTPRFDRVPDLEYYFLGAVGAQSLLLEDVAEYRVETNAEPEPFPLLPITNKLEDLFFEIHSCMRDIDGLHADSALEELCKLLYVKAFVEENAAELSESALRSASFGCTEEYAAAIRGQYKDAAEYDLRVFGLRIPQYQRSRGVFQEPMRLGSAALVRSFQLLEHYSLARTKTDVKGRAFQKVLSKAVRSGMGQYFTPREICDFVVDVVRPSVHSLVLDPFCGSGHFLSRSLAMVAESSDAAGKEFHEFAFSKLHGIEKSDRMSRIAMTDMRLSGDGHSNIRCVDALLDFENYPDLSPDSFDVVLTNPPFGSLLGTDALAGLGRFELAAGRRSLPLEVLGLERAIAFLRPGGRLAIVLPDSVLSAESTAFVRDWLKNRIKVRAVVSLPVATFSPFGANVKTGILFARKWRAGELRRTDYDVCLVKVENVGFDAAGRQIVGSDLGRAAEDIRSFLQDQGW